MADEYAGNIKLKVELDTDEAGKKSEKLSKAKKSELTAEAERLKKEAAELQKQADELKKRANEVRAKLTDTTLTKKQQGSIVKEANMFDTQAGNLQKQANELKLREKDALAPLDESGKSTKKTQANFAKMAKGITSALKKIKSMILGAFVFSVISKGIQAASVYLKEMISQNDALKNSLGQVKGNLETTFITILQAAMPLIEQLSAVIAQLTAGMAALVSNMFGKTVDEAQSSAKEIADAANDAQKSFAGFDEINTISGGDSDIESKYEVEADAMNAVPEALVESGESIMSIFKSIFDLIKSLIPKIVKIIEKLLPIVATVLGFVAAVLPLLMPIIDMVITLLDPIGELIEALTPLIETVTDFLSGYLAVFLPVLQAEVKLFVSYISNSIKAITTVLSNVIDFIKNVFAGNWAGAWQNIINITGAYIDFFKNIFASVVTFLSDIWNHVGDFFTSVWEVIVYGAKMAAWGIQTYFLGTVNFVIGIINAMIDGALGMINILIDALNYIPGVNIGRLSWSIPTIPLPPMPALAQGAVVPRSKPFAAILGDNTQETEVVSPLSTMKQALSEVLTEFGGLDGGENTIILNIDGRELGRAVAKYGGTENSRQGAKLVVKNA
ncbi:MAG: hypothetical protein LBP79_01285 [Clostridiales bacterium]|jgi:phage-related protein|nr:hypothetical protein [Clostridiales bacterium]